VISICRAKGDKGRDQIYPSPHASLSHAFLTGLVQDSLCGPGLRVPKIEIKVINVSLSLFNKCICIIIIIY
jgi:hypothetical protein